MENGELGELLFGAFDFLSKLHYPVNDRCLLNEVWLFLKSRLDEDEAKSLAIYIYSFALYKVEFLVEKGDEFFLGKEAQNLGSVVKKALAELKNGVKQNYPGYSHLSSLVHRNNSE